MSATLIYLVFLLSYLPPCCFQLSRAYSYTLTYPTVLTIVHSNGTYILSHDTRSKTKIRAKEEIYKQNLKLRRHIEILRLT
jgi:hypothetical protein